MEEISYNVYEHEYALPKSHYTTTGGIEIENMINHNKMRAIVELLHKVPMESLDNMFGLEELQLDLGKVLRYKIAITNV